MDFPFAWGEEATLSFCCKHILLSPIFRRLFRTKWALQTSPVLMAGVVVGLITGWQLFSKALMFSILETSSAASGSCHLVVTVPPCGVPLATQTVVFPPFHENKKKTTQSILSKAPCPRLLISTLDPPVSFIFHLQTTHQPLEDCRWYPWLRWKKMPKAWVNICKSACPLQLALLGSWSQRQCSNKTQE